MNDPKYGYPYPPPPAAYQGHITADAASKSNGAFYLPNEYGQHPPVTAPPQYYAAQQQPRPQKEVGFLEGCLAALCCCCLLDECCCDPSIVFVS